MNTLKIIAIVRDMFWVSRIKEASRNKNIELTFLREINDHSELNNSSLIIIDLADSQLNPIETIKKIRRSSTEVEIIGYYPHVRKDLMKDCMNAGCSSALTNSIFSKELINIISKKTK